MHRRALARRTRRIALQSVLAGMALSAAAMAFAAAGLLPAVWGALLQEAIDVAVILNALRVLIPVPAGRPMPPAALPSVGVAETGPNVPQAGTSGPGARVGAVRS